MFDANNISARSYACELCVISALNACRLTPCILTLNTFEIRNVIRYSLRILLRIFSAKIGRKKKIFRLGRKNNILINKNVS